MRSRRTFVVGLVTGLVAVGLVPALAAPAPTERARGILEVVHGDHFGHDHHHAWQGEADDTTLPNMEYWLREGDGATRLEFATPPGLATGTELSVTGERRGGRIAVSSFRVEAAAGGKKGGSGGPGGSFIGERNMLVLNFNFATGDEPMTPEDLRTAAFTGTNSVANYYRATSFGQMSLTGKSDGDPADKDAAIGDVTRWYTLSGFNPSICDYDRWATSARNTAVADGWDLSGYEHVMYVFPYTAACQWRGLGQLGGSVTWINGIAPTFHQPLEGLMAHEIGHNLTLYHSRTWECTGSDGVRVSIANNCSYAEYGDRFEVMGSGYRHLNARNKPHLGWMPSTNIVTGVNGGLYTLSPIESAATGAQVLKVSRGRKSGYLYVEARGVDQFDPVAGKESGAVIHTGADPSTNGNSYLVDGTPGTAAFEDAPYGAGEAFVDTVSGVSIEVLAVNPDGSIQVRVRTAQSNAGPTASSSGGHGIETGTAHTHEGATATDSNKNLASYRWAWASCPSTCPALSDAAGIVAGGNASVPGPTFTAGDAGSYTLVLTVWDAAGAKTTLQVTDTATAPVVTPAL